MRPQEPAHVDLLDFCIAEDGDTLALLTLRLTDEGSPLCGCCFQVGTWLVCGLPTQRCQGCSLTQEPAHMDLLDYCTAEDGSEDPVALLALRLKDEGSPLCSCCFQVGAC